MVGLVLVAIALGLSNFAAAIAIGLAGVDVRLRVRIALVFGVFEAAMPLVGLLLGRHLASSFGSRTADVGGALLVATGTYTIWQARRGAGEQDSVGSRLAAVTVTGAALSIDNLVVGFALGTRTVPVALAAVVIALVSVTMSLVGLELGQRIGQVVERWSEEIGGAVLIMVGLAIAVGLL